MTSRVQNAFESVMDNARRLGKSRLVGIFGKPVGHTLSPSMQNAAFEAAGMADWHYAAFEVDPSELGEAVAAIKKYRLAGVNITVPHKETVLGYLDSIEGLAREIGAVNTVAAGADGRLIGYNTDAAGFLNALDEEGFSPSEKKVLVLGAGGASRAVVAALKSRGASGIAVYDTVFDRAAAMAAKFGVEAIASPFALRGFDLVVNASPVGMKNGDPSPVPKPVLLARCADKDAAGVTKNFFVYDLVYNRKTELLGVAEALGFKSAGGLGMLLHQGALSFEIWTGQAAPLEAMRKILKAGRKVEG